MSLNSKAVWEGIGLGLVMALAAVAAAVAAFLASLMFSLPSRSADDHAWFKALKQPDSGASCCDISDCHFTEGAEWRADGWYAPVLGVMTRMPENKTLWKSVRPDGRAVVCHGPESEYTPMGMTAPRTPTIYCFVPPSLGS